MTQHEKNYYLRKYKEELLGYSLGDEYLKLFEYKNGKIVTERAWIFTYDYSECNGMINIDSNNGYPLCKEDIESLIEFLVDIKKKAYTRQEMKAFLMNQLKKKIKEIENTDTCDEKKPYKRQKEKHYIYFARFVGKELFKVGFSKNPDLRIKQLQLLTTEPLEMVALIPIDIGIRPDFFEKRVHQYLEDNGSKVRGELFFVNNELLQDVLKKFGGELL